MDPESYSAIGPSWGIGHAAPITNFLQPVSAEIEQSGYNTIITPEILHNSKNPYNSPSPILPLQAEKGNEEILDEWQTEASQYAEIDSFHNF